MVRKRGKKYFFGQQVKNVVENQMKSIEGNKMLQNLKLLAHYKMLQNYTQYLLK